MKLKALKHECKFCLICPPSLVTPSHPIERPYLLVVVVVVVVVGDTCSRVYIVSTFSISSTTADGRNPAPPGMYKTL